MIVGVQFNILFDYQLVGCLGIFWAGSVVTL